MIGFAVKLLFARLLPLVILGFAIFVGWLNTFPIPEGIMFAMVYPILKGHVPPIISGGYKDCPVLPLPSEDDEDEDDFATLEERPPKETFVVLPGYSPQEDDGIATDTCNATIEGEEEDTAATADTTGSNATTEEREDGEIIGTPQDEEEEEEKMIEVPKAYKIPQQGIGMCCRHTAYDAESVRRTILWYLRVGGRHIDTADLYQNHVWIGQALQVGMQRYQIPRNEIWITTKLWPRHFGSASTKQAIKRMLQELQLDYIDLLLLHAPSNQFAFLGQGKTECALKEHSPKECRQETWRTLSKLKEETGIIRHIGVSNFNVHQLEELMESEANDDGNQVAPIANHQFQYNPWVADHVHEVFDYCQQNNISVTAWSSFAGSLLQHMEAFSVETLNQIASKHSTTVAQILLKWAMQKGAIVIPGTGNPKHMRENLNAYNLQLSPQEMKQINDLKNDESARNFFVSATDKT